MNNHMLQVVILTVFGLIVPLVLILKWKKKTGTDEKTFLAGAVCYFFFAKILQNLANTFLLSSSNPAGAFVTGNNAVYVLYVCLSAGLIEETGRRFGFGNLLKEEKNPAVSVSFGLGYAGIEQFFTVGIAYLLILLVMCGTGFTSEQMNASYLALGEATTWSKLLLTILERLDAFLLQIGLSMIVFCSVQGVKKKALYPLAILLHALASAPAALFQVQAFSSSALLEVLMFICSAAVFAVGVRALRRYFTEFRLFEWFFRFFQK